MKYLFNQVFDEIQYFTNDFFKTSNKLEIILCKVYKQKRKIQLQKIIESKEFWRLFFIENDDVDLKENGIMENNISFNLIHDISTIKYYIIGIEREFFDNGLKEEKMLCFEPISKFTYWLLKSRFNPILKN